MGRNKKKRKHDKERPAGWYDPKYTSNMKHGDYGPGNQYIRYANDMIPNQDGIEYGRSGYNSDMYRRSGYPYYGNTDVYAAADDIRRRNHPESDSINHDTRHRNEYHRWRDRNWWDRTADEVASWFGNINAEERRRIDKIEGPYRGKGPKGYVRSDEKITEEINDCLYRDSNIDASDIEVRVHNGEAVLSGTVEDKLIKRKVEDAVEMIPGIINVENKLKINKREDHHVERSTEPVNMSRRNWS